MIRLNQRLPRTSAILLLGLMAASLFWLDVVKAVETNLVFDPGHYSPRTGSIDGKQVSYRAYEGIVSVKNPVDVQYQTINIYIPNEYFEGKSINGFTADTAPIYFHISIGGYMPGVAAKPGEGFDGLNNSMLNALAQGYVVAAPGARGRSIKSADGKYSGKAPAAIVDLKAAVRYLRFNDKLLPGNAERIISDGTSAGGALSALLGATGNSADYEPYLKALGAADARDDIFAVAAYCPITNLENADAAYEWLFGSLKQTKEMGPPPGANLGAKGGANRKELPPGGSAPRNAGPWGAPHPSSGPLTAAQIALSSQLKAQFRDYVNSLKLKSSDDTLLTLDADGSGNFRDLLKSYLITSAQAALDAGNNLSKFKWVRIENGKVTDIDWRGYVEHCGRKKGVPSFDALDLSSGENNEFGTATVNNQHFTAFGQAHNTVAGATRADESIVKMMNPMPYIGAAATSTAKFWRIRHGSIDSDTASAISLILATKLANEGFSVDYALPWEVPHSGDYDLPELFSWINKIVK